MVHYKLIYFNSRGRGEPIRILLALAGAEYEDIRVEHGEKWQAMKPSTPFGQVPVLEVDGFQLAQTKAILRFLGREFKLAGHSNLESAKADMLVDGVDDVSTHLRPAMREKDPEKKKELFEAVKTSHIEPFLKRYEHFLEKSGHDYFINNQITWADIYLFDAFQKWEHRHPELFQGHPKLRHFIEKVAGNPNIKRWIETRPATEN